jgi:hypothetical protein
MIVRKLGVLLIAALAMVLVPATSEAATHKCRTADSWAGGGGAYAKGTLCWETSGSPRKFWVDNGVVEDVASDGMYGQFRIHWRIDTILGTETHTKIIKTTKGKYAPARVTFSWDSSGIGSNSSLKDFWMQACRQGSGIQYCDTHWH